MDFSHKREYHPTRPTVFTEGFTTKTADAYNNPARKKNISQQLSSFQTVSPIIDFLPLDT